MTKQFSGEWSLVLGASSGFGAAVALELARNGSNILGVHLDRRQAMPAVEAIISGIEKLGVQAKFFNINVADAEKRQAGVAEMAALARRPLRVVLHSIAFGTTGLGLLPDSNGAALSQKQIEMTLDTMANSLVYWVQDLYNAGLVGKGTRIYGMTSAGNQRVIPGYGAVSAAKSVLESHLRQLAVELAPHGATANAIQAGVTDTPALSKIPGAERLREFARGANPSQRMTTPEDVARVIVALSADGTEWMTGNVIRVDGGEDLVITP
ncbi:MAG: SDR family oxidoreductase [Chloroflexi bacterium CFX7]|nr:SDR family oxidoreductase [Chloroflexi bacterium CFX7]MCK6563476.1 SDR family oxidoreductase [Dehalococcoidia bacterium]RIL04376.1 MAG: 3-oxoacyl-ACP reductase [bacterium]